MGRIPTWMGRVAADGGRVELFQRGLYGRWLKGKAGQLVSVTVEPAKRRRSHRQNDFWWAVVVPLVADACGYTAREHQEVHEQLVRVLLGEKPGSHASLPIRPSTAQLTTQEFSRLIEQAQIWAAEQLGLVIPDPDAEWAVRKWKRENTRRVAQDARVSRVATHDDSLL